MAKAEEYRERVQATHPTNPSATDWNPQQAVDDRAQSSGQKLANFRADWDAGNISKETLEAAVTDRLGTGHLSNESRDTLHRYHDRDQGTPMMSWEIKHYHDLMEESTRNFAKALMQNGMSPEETFSISRELRTQYRALDMDRRESGRSQLEGNDPHPEQYSSNHQGEDGQRAVLQFLHQTRGGTVNEHDTTRMLTGNYPDSHMPEERRERLLELHQASATLDPAGANAQEYAELLHESKERLVHIFTQETPWNRYDDRNNREGPLPRRSGAPDGRPALEPGPRSTGDRADLQQERRRQPQPPQPVLKPHAPPGRRRQSHGPPAGPRRARQ